MHDTTCRLDLGIAAVPAQLDGAARMLNVTATGGHGRVLGTRSSILIGKDRRRSETAPGLVEQLWLSGPFWLRIVPPYPWCLIPA